MSRSDALVEKEAILQRLEAAKRRRDRGETARRLSELRYMTRAEDDANLKQARLDWLDQHRIDGDDIV